MRLHRAVVAVVIVGTLVACGGGKDDTTSTTTRARRTASTTVPSVLAPLTGLRVSAGTVDRPAIAVKIDNVNLRRRPPQAGLDQADVVYEEPVEFATRFLALFQSQTPARVGPVRSTRFIDPGIVWPVHGLYVYSGGTPEKVAAIRDAPVKTFDEDGLVAAGARERDPSIPAPHNLFAHLDALSAKTDDRTPPAPLFQYRVPRAAVAGDPVRVFEVNIPGYQHARYTWDGATGTWKREELLGGSSSLQPHVAASGTQLAPANVIVQRIAGVDDKAQLTGEGDAWVFTGGKEVRAHWQRATLDDRTVFTDAGGTEVLLAPGQTWVHFITAGEPAVAP
jgi:hypothetical protein